MFRTRCRASPTNQNWSLKKVPTLTSPLTCGSGPIGLELAAAADGPTTASATADAEEIEVGHGFGKRISDLWREQRLRFIWRRR